LVENTVIRRPGAPARAAGAWVRPAVPLAADHHRVTRAGAQRLLEHLGRQLIDREHDAERCVRARHAVHVLEADWARESGPEDGHDRPGRVELLHQVFHHLELRGARELDREPRAQARVGLDDGDVEAGRSLHRVHNRGERLHGGYLLLAAALAAPVSGAGWSGARSTR
jgi:hypothetical protein